MRVTHHLAVLALLAVMTLSGLGAGWEKSTPVVLAAASPAPVVNTLKPSVVQATPPAIVNSLSTTPSSIGPSRQVAPTPMATAPIAVSAQSAPPQPARSWVQNFRSADLFDGPGPQATRIGTASQFSTFELVEQVENGRSRLFDPGRGEGRLPEHVWADLTDFGPTGPPKYQYELARGGEVDATTGKRAPDRVAFGWPPLPLAESAVIVDGESGALLYARNGHARLPQASTTKIMAAIVAIENGRLTDRVTVDVDSNHLASTTESTVMGLMPGQTLTLETLLYGMMLSSGNDAAIAIAKHVGGSEARFVEMMNAKAKALGLHNTQFKNPHGLDANGHYSSAYDLAIMSRYGMQNPTFYSLSNTRHWSAEGFDLWNMNKLLPVYPGADGVKPGFTDNAGRCLVGSAVRDNHRVFVTVLNSLDTTGDSRALLDYAFGSFRWPS
jgi:D-alanyl-D-alanine carboxypeptidase